MITTRRSFIGSFLALLVVPASAFAAKFSPVQGETLCLTYDERRDCWRETVIGYWLPNRANDVDVAAEYAAASTDDERYAVIDAYMRADIGTQLYHQ